MEFGTFIEQKTTINSEKTLQSFVSLRQCQATCCEHQEKKLEDLDWGQLCDYQPVYSPDNALSEYHLPKNLETFWYDFSNAIRKMMKIVANDSKYIG